MTTPSSTPCFFFQAEDGIRDVAVTGVQTCALPIFSTRVIGAIIMVHGDDQGLVLPPKLAPYQTVIVPIFKTDEEKTIVFETARKLKADLVKANIRVTLDEREGDRKSTRLNSSHGYISYAVFCLKKKNNIRSTARHNCKNSGDAMGTT